MKVKVSVNHPGPNGSSGGRTTDVDVPFVPGKTTVGDALKEAASRLAAANKMVPNLTLSKMPSQVTAVTGECIGQDWIRNRVQPTVGFSCVPPGSDTFTGTLRYHVAPALVSSDEEDSSDDDSESKSASGSGGDGSSAIRSSGVGGTDGCQLRMVRTWPFEKILEARQRTAVLSSPLYEYHVQEGLTVSDLTRITTIRIPIDDEGASVIIIRLSDFGGIEAVLREQTQQEGKTLVEELDIDLPENTGSGATIHDLKAVGE